jgi:hypothetical protein
MEVPLELSLLCESLHDVQLCVSIRYTTRQELLALFCSISPLLCPHDAPGGHHTLLAPQRGTIKQWNTTDADNYTSNLPRVGSQAYARAL